MADDKASDDRTPIARRNFLLGAGTAVAATLGTPAEAQQTQAALRLRPLRLRPSCPRLRRWSRKPI